jgi:hypothetical protein
MRDIETRNRYLGISGAFLGAILRVFGATPKGRILMVRRYTAREAVEGIARFGTDGDQRLLWLVEFAARDLSEPEARVRAAHDLSTLV